jgi:hypothetical protein
MTSLEALREQHDHARNPRARASLRVRARALAARLGIAPPAWAALRGDEKPASRPPVVRSERPAPAPATGPIVVPEALPAPLREWRARNPGSIVRVTRARVELHELGAPTRSFATIDAAISAVRA